MPLNFDLFNGESRKIFLKPSSVSASQSDVVKLSISGIGLNLISCVK